MDPFSNKINKNTIKFVNKTYTKLKHLQCQRSYLSDINQYDDIATTGAKKGFSYGL